MQGLKNFSILVAYLCMMGVGLWMWEQVNWYSMFCFVPVNYLLWLYMCEQDMRVSDAEAETARIADHFNAMQQKYRSRLRPGMKNRRSGVTA